MNAIAVAKYIMDSVTDDNIRYMKIIWVMNVVVMTKYMMIYLYKYLYRIL